MSNCRFAKLFEVEGKQVLVYKDRDDLFLIRFTAQGELGLYSLEIEYECQNKRDEIFDEMCEKDAEMFLSMLKAEGNT